MMKCQRCEAALETGEVREHQGQVLCEDCYMDACSPAKACDPWAVYSAKSLEKHCGQTVLTPIQMEILAVLQETGGHERPALFERFQGKLSQSELEREFATLRHMEKARAEKRGDKVFLRLW